MKQILLISRCPPYPIHFGDRLIIWHLARILNERGYQIDLIAFTNRQEDYEERSHYQQYFREITLLDEPHRTQTDYLLRLLLPGRRFPKRAEQAWSPPMWNAIQNALQHNAYDMVHVFGGVQVYEFFRLFEGQPNLITPYESFSLYLQRQIIAQTTIQNRVQAWVARNFERWMYDPYERVVVVAEPDHVMLQRINPKLPIEIIPNGVDIEFFQPQALERDTHTLLFTGNFEYEPNIDAAQQLAKHILPQVQATIPDARLQLVGNAPQNTIQDLANEHIEVTGSVPDLRPYLAQASGVCLSLATGCRYQK